MKAIIFDNLIYAVQHSGGISVYWTELLKRFYDQQRDDIAYFHINYKGAEENRHFSEVLGFGSSIRLSGGRFASFARKILPFKVRFFNGEALFHSSNLRVAVGRNVKNVITIHDLIYEKKYINGPKRLLNILQKKIAIRYADVIIVISENTKRDLLQFYPESRNKDIVVVYNGVSNIFDEDGDVSALNLPAKYILFVGDRSKYKNFESVVKAVSKLPDYSLVVTGGKKIGKQDMSLLESELPGRYRRYDYITTEQLSGVYRRAHVLMYPSSYEGFGIPLVEAMRSGCPVIAQRKSSIPEIAEGYAFLTDDADVSSLIEGVKFFENQLTREDFIQRGIERSRAFTWEACFSRTNQVYESLLSS